ncbi:MAG: periplasmic heavy metal sensor [Bacteroidetes bacterium]|nr:periplasmic heavy metal sensor [Bacteroidota bacterium]
MRTKLLVITISLLVAGGTALAQQRGPRGPMQMGRHPMFLAQLKLTDQQKTEVRKVWFDLMQKQIDVRAKLQHDRLDYHELALAETPDPKALSAKIQDMADLRAQLQQNKLDAWFSVNKLLTPDQQKVWKKVLEHPMMFEKRVITMRMDRRGRFGNMMDRMRMQGGQQMMRGGFMQDGQGPMMWKSRPSTASPDSNN